MDSEVFLFLQFARGASCAGNVPVNTSNGKIFKNVWLYIDGRDERGKITEWRFEMGIPGGLTVRGWKKTELKAGDAVTSPWKSLARRMGRA